MSKICLMNGDKIEEIIVFSLDDESSKIFNEDELENIKRNNIPVRIFKNEIYKDDSIEEIKRKIIIAYEETYSKRIAFDEIYLFGIKSRSFDPVMIYQSLTNSDKIDLTRARFIEFLLNFVSINIDDVEVKEMYNFSDILNLNLEKTHLIKIPIGQKLVTNKNRYSYTVNPFDVLVYDNYLKSHATDILSTTNGSLLLDYGDLFNNTMYLCLAEDVFKFNESSSTEEFASKIYFPFLNQNKIVNLETLENKKEKLLSETKKKK